MRRILDGDTRATRNDDRRTRCGRDRRRRGVSLLEQLEERTLLASSISITAANALTFQESALNGDSITQSLSGSTYTIHDAHDIINVTNSGTAVVTGSGTSTVTVSPVISLAFLTGGGNGDAFIIQSTAQPVTLTNNFAGTLNVVSLGVANSTQALGATVTLAAGAGSTSLVVNNSASTSNESVILTSSGPNGTIVGLSPQAITFATAALHSLTLSGSTAINSYLVVSTPATIPTTLFTGYGTNSVTVQGTAGPFALNDQGVDTVTLANTAAGSLNGTMTLKGGLNSTTLILDDSLDTSARTVLATTGEVIGVFPQPVSYLPAAVTSLTIKGGTRFMTLNVNAGKIGPVNVVPGGANGSATIGIDNVAPILYTNATAVNVTNVADQLLAPLNKPVVTTTGDPQNEGRAVALLVASFKDTDPDAKSGNFTVQVDWGDGTNDTAAATASNDNTQFDVSATHTYLEEGTYNVVVTVSDTGTSDTSIIGGIPVTTSDLGGSGLTTGVITQTNLVSDGTPPAPNTDTHLVNPWDIAYGPNTSFWVTDNKTGVATLYDGSGVPQPSSPGTPLVVTIPPPTGKSGPSSPSGVVFNTDSTGFVITSGAASAPATFLFATQDGTISGWNATVPPPPVSTQAILAVDRSAFGASFTGLALANTGGVTRLYAADFRLGSIDVFNDAFALVGSFTDASIPPGFSPFGIKNINGDLYVTYARPDISGRAPITGLGQGFVDIFAPDGTLINRLASNAPLNAPYGLALAPSNFGQFSNDLLVGNNGDGRINAFDPNTGEFKGAFFDATNTVISIAGLHALTFGSGQGAGATNTLYFASGPGGGAHGLVGSFSATPNTAVIDDPPLHTSISTISAIEGIPFSGVVGSFTDDNPRPDSGDFTATIVWGDGTTSAGTITANNTPGAGFIVTGSHVFPEETTGGPPLKTMLTVTDVGGSSAFAEGVANIADAKIVPSAVQPTLLAREDVPINNVVVATFTDENPNPPFSDFQAPYLPTIAWGDGKTTFGTVVADPNIAGLLDVVGSHTYTEETLVNPATVTVTLSDEGGSKATALATAIVSDATLVATGLVLPNPYTPPIYEGKAFTGDVAKLLDSNALATAGNFTISIDWGDGTAALPDVTPGTVREDAFSTFTVTGSHTYVEEGRYTTTVFIKDVGGATAIVTGAVVVSDAPLQITPIAVSATEGAPFVLVPVASFTDGDPFGIPADFGALIAWGDGGVTPGAIIQPDGPGTKFTVLGSYTYVEDGKFSVAVAVSDFGGSTATTGTFSGNGTLANVADAKLAASPAAAQPNINAIVMAATGSPVAEGTSFTSAVARFSDAAFPGGIVGPFTASVDWGDGTSSSGTTAVAGGVITVTGTHTYTETKPSAVPFPVKVTLNDRDGSTASTTRSLVVADAALSPLGSIPITAIEGQPLNDVVVGSFGDSNPTSTASDFGAQVTWGDGTSPFAAQVIETAFHQFDVVASHTYVEDTTGAAANAITVTITDNEGSRIIRNNTATVLDAPLESVGAPSVPGIAGVALSVSNPFIPDLATFTDANPLAPLADFTARVDWGDGTPQIAGLIRQSGLPAEPTWVVAADHTYAASGDFQITVFITDVGGSTSVALSEAIVRDGKIAAAAPNLAAPEGQAFAGQVAQFVDANPAEVAANFTAVINWGDGIITPGVVAAAGAGFSVSGTHTYEEGIFRYLVTVTDENGNSASSSATFTVTDADLTPVAAPALSSIAGRALTHVVVGSFSDANPRATIDDFSVSIDWGDGSALDAGTVVKGVGFFDVIGSHTYTKESVYPISVTVNDIGGSNANPTNSARVADAPLAAEHAALFATEGVPFTQAVATFTDSDPTATAADISDIAVSWGDGTVDHLGGNVAIFPVGISPAGVTFIVFGTHTYNDDDLNMEVDGNQILVIIGDKGGSATSVASGISVADPVLTDPGFNVQAIEGVPFAGKVASFTDSSPFAKVSDFSATVTWGDGQSSTGVIAPNPSGGFLVLGNHTFGQSGSYTVGVTIRDDEGKTVSDTSTATILDAPLSSQGVALTARPRTSFQGTVATFRDPNASSAASSFTAAIAWGDGTMSRGTIVASASSAGGLTFVVNGAHTYKKQGHLPLTVVITDSGGSKTIASSLATVSSQSVRVSTHPSKPPKPPKPTHVPTKSRKPASTVKALAASTTVPSPNSSVVRSPRTTTLIAAPSATIDAALAGIAGSSKRRRNV
jgi:uncharacterized protein (TIGR03118 family)